MKYLGQYLAGAGCFVQGAAFLLVVEGQEEHKTTALGADLLLVVVPHPQLLEQSWASRPAECLGVSAGRHLAWL